MPEILVFTVHTVPVPQPRHTVSRKTGRAFIPSGNPIHQFKADLKSHVREQYSGPVMDGAITLHCFFLLPRTKGMIWKKKPMPRVKHTKKPDTDNLMKAVKDALTGILWRDDSQVWYEVGCKEYHSGDESPRVLIHVYEELL